MVAFLFPGQGSQVVGMGADVYEAYAAAAAVIDRADRLLDFPLKAMMFGAGGDPDAEQEALTATDVAQPALYVHSIATMAVLREHGHAPDMVAGHSLGEYSALAAVGAIDLEDGLQLVRLRGRLMAEAGSRRPGAMSAILNLDAATVERICAEASASSGGVVQPANYNSPGQLVISGDVDAVATAGELASAAGARRVVPLPVSGAFHSPLMEFALEGLGEALRSVDFRAPTCPVYLNVTAQPTTNPDEIRHRLLEQLTAPVRWAQTLETMHADGATRFVEVGAGNVLSGLARKTLGRDIDTVLAGTADRLRELTTASAAGH